MPYIGIDFAPCSPGEVSVERQMDLACFMNPLEQLVSATWSCVAMPGFTPDPLAATRVVTTGLINSIDPSDLITATYSSMTAPVAGARYELRVRVTTNQNAGYEYWSYLYCQPDKGA